MYLVFNVNIQCMSESAVFLRCIKKFFVSQIQILCDLLCQVIAGGNIQAIVSDFFPISGKDMGEYPLCVFA